MIDRMYESPSYRRDGVRCRPGESTGTNWRLVGVSLLYFVVIGSLCGAFYEVGQRSGYNKAISELDRQPRLWRCVLDPRDITSGVAAEAVILATRPEIALRTAQEKAQWGERRAYVQPCTENYPDVISMRVTP